ncbi:AsnC family transcriptional regulator [Litoreibacter meonggei]|uniref:AsnC family transcriptional regulator n=2 Tax=Litoreibacter meonggei TaxID=1049199 RepID=A0A497WLC5_9RHOB|nr:AsnC family transcriptional regulator [Litoreibacter meonggei]
MTRLDSIDIRLLELLQRDAQTTAQTLSEVLHLSPSQVGRRRQRLEMEGYIIGTACKASAKRLGLTVQAFVQIQTVAHAAETHSAIEQLIGSQPEITAAWTLTGDADYLLRVYCADLSALNHLIQNVLLPHPSIGRVQSQVVMDQLKTDAPLPVFG